MLVVGALLKEHSIHLMMKLLKVACPGDGAMGVVVDDVGDDALRRKKGDEDLNLRNAAIGNHHPSFRMRLLRHSMVCRRSSGKVCEWWWRAKKNSMK